MSDLQFTIDREAFISAVNWVARTIPSRPVSPILGGIRIIADGNTVSLAAFDYEVSAEIAVAAEVGVTGTALVSGRLLAAIGKALPKKPVTFRAEGNIVRLSCGAAECTLPTMLADDFPTLPIMPTDTGTIDAEIFAGAIAQTVVAVHRGDGYPVLQGVQLEVTSADTLTLVATDRHRVAVRELPWTAQADAPIGAKLVIPSRVVGEIGRMTDGDVALAFDGNLLGIHGGARKTTTRLIDGDFPNVRQILPNEHTAVATIAAPALAEALNRATLLDEQEFPRVKLAFEPGIVHLIGGKDGIGAIREDVGLESFVGDPIEMWFNPKYFLDALNAANADKVLVGFTGPRRPVLLVPHDEINVEPPASGGLRSSYMHMVMPTTGDVG